MLKPFKILNLLNLDVAIGAMIFSCYFSQLFDVAINRSAISILGLSVWAIYTFDHLIDAKKSGNRNKSSIHLFHKKYHKTFTVFLIVSLVVIALLLPLLPTSTLLGGTLLALVVLIYFITINFLPVRKIYHKEVMIALVYFSGVLLLPMTNQNFEFSTSHMPILMAYFIVVTLNLFTFSVFESNNDSASGFPSLTQSTSFTYVHWIIISLSLLLFLIVCLFSRLWDIPSLGLCFSMVSILLLLYSFKERKFIKAHYRILGDGIFYIPGLYFLL